MKARVTLLSIALLLPILAQGQGSKLDPGSVFAPNEPEAAAALNAGTAAFRAGDYQAAKSSFQKVVAIAPSVAVGHLYLGTVCAMLMERSEQGKANGDLAVKELRAYLTSHPSYRPALILLGQVYWKQEAYEDALTNYRAADRQESDLDSAYAIGAINRTICQLAIYGNHASLNVDETPSLVTSQSCQKLRRECLQRINEGIDYTQRALRLKPNYDEAMLEMMLLFEFRSRLACGDPRTQKDDHEQSIAWRHKLEQASPDMQQK